MFNSINVLPGADLSTGAIVLTVFVAGAMLAALAAFGVVAFRRAGDGGVSGNLWRGGLILVGIVFAWIVLGRSGISDQMAERRSIETRGAELTVRAMAPGSALACLDAVAGATIEAACEKALFATPEAVAAAVAYVDARLSLLASSVAFGERDPALRPSIERLRRAIEGDRFGLVAHVLMTRGCSSTDCPDLKLVRDTSRIMSNMRSRAFDAHINVHAQAWNPGGVTVNALAAAPSTSVPSQAAAAAPQSLPAMAQPSMLPPSVSATQPPPFIPQPVASAPAPAEQPVAAGAPTPAHPPGTPGKYDYPSSASIPAVSIMSAEPTGPPAAEAKPAPPPARRPAKNEQRAPSSREAAPRQTAPQQAPPPQPAPQPPAPQTSGAR